MLTSGNCYCGGHIIKDWGGIRPEFHCDKCGIVLNHGGRRKDRSIFRIHR